MTSLIHILAQAAPEATSGSSGTIRIVAGVVALVLVVVIVIRRKKKASKEDWS